MDENHLAELVFIFMVIGGIYFYNKGKSSVLIEKKHEDISLVFLSDAERLILPFMKMDGYEKLFTSNKRLKKLKKEIADWSKLNPPTRMGQMFPKYQKLDEEVEEMFKEYADICSAYLNKD